MIVCKITHLKPETHKRLMNEYEINLLFYLPLIALDIFGIATRSELYTEQVHSTFDQRFSRRNFIYHGGPSWYIVHAAKYKLIMN